MEANMKYVYQLYLDRSFSKAAEHLYMTQPALSIAIKRVEAELGAELFDRSRHPLELTQAGEAYIATIRQIRHLEEELQREVDDLKQLGHGTLRLGGTHYINNYILADALADFAGAHPGVTIDLEEGSARRLTGMLRDRELDLTFSCAAEVLEEFEHVPAFSDHILLTVPERAVPEDVLDRALTAEDILAGRHLSGDVPPVTLDHFRESEFILMRPGNNLHERSMKMFQDAGMTPHVRLSLSQLVTAFHLAEEGLGAAFVSDRLVRSPTPGLRYFLPDSPEAERQFCFILPPRQYTPFAVKEFLEFAKQRLA